MVAAATATLNAVILAAVVLKLAMTPCSKFDADATADGGEDRWQAVGANDNYRVSNIVAAKKRTYRAMLFRVVMRCLSEEW